MSYIRKFLTTVLAGVIGVLARAGICVWQTYLVVTRRQSGRLHLMK